MPASEILTEMKSQIVACPTFSSRVLSENPGATVSDHVFFMRNESDLPIDQDQLRPYCIVDYPVLSWNQEDGERCYRKNYAIQVDFYDQSEGDTDSDSARYFDYVEAIIDYVLANSLIRFISVSEKARPVTPNKINKTDDGINDFWFSAYLFQSSTG